MGPWHLHASAGHRGADHLDDPADAWPVRSDVIRSFLGPHLPDGIPAMLFALSRCGERDVTLALELALDLAVQSFLVAFHRQEHVGALGEAPAKNACVVCRASAWIKVPSSSRVLRSSLSAALSLDLWVS